MRFRTLVALFVIMVAAVIVAASEEGANAAKLKLKPTSFAAKIKAAAAKAQKRKNFAGGNFPGMPLASQKIPTGPSGIKAVDDTKIPKRKFPGKKRAPGYKIKPKSSLNSKRIKKVRREKLPAKPKKGGKSDEARPKGKRKKSKRAVKGEKRRPPVLPVKRTKVTSSYSDFEERSRKAMMKHIQGQARTCEEDLDAKDCETFQKRVDVDGDGIVTKTEITIFANYLFDKIYDSDYYKKKKTKANPKKSSKPKTKI